MPVRLTIRAVPGSRRAGVVGRYGDGWKLRVVAAPDKGRANAELETWLAAALGTGRGSVRVVVGTSSRDKVVEVAGTDDLAAIESLLEGMIDGSAGK